MTVKELLQQQLDSAHQLVEQTVGEVTPEQLSFEPGGKAFSLGSLYGHVVFSEDAIVQGLIRHETPLYQGEWKEKTGASTPLPDMDEKWSEANTEWSHTVRIDLPVMREYAKAVYAKTAEYISSLSDEDFEKEIDLGPWGTYKLGILLTGFIIGHAFSLAGEMSAVKGVQGLKGYPF